MPLDILTTLPHCALLRGSYRYTEDLKKLVQNSGAGPSVIDSCQSIMTPLCLPAWTHELSQFPDRWLAGFILNGIHKGFPIGVDTKTITLKSAQHNHPHVIDSYLENEVSLQRMVGPLPASAHIHISPMSIIPKPRQPGKWRLIIDLSSPKGKSVNDAIIPQLCSLQYSRVDHVAQVVRVLGKGTLMCKLDLNSAYRVVPVHPSDRGFAGTAKCL